MKRRRLATLKRVLVEILARPPLSLVAWQMRALALVTAVFAAAILLAPTHHDQAPPRVATEVAR